MDPRGHLEGHVPELQPVVASSQSSRPAQVPSCQPAHQSGPRLGDSLPDQRCDDKLLREWREGDLLGPRPDRLRQLVRPSRQQDEHRVQRRLFQHLQQDVRGFHPESIGLEDHHDLPARLRRRQVRAGGEPPGRVRVLGVLAHQDVRASRLEHQHFRMALTEGQAAGPALAATAIRAEQGGGERPHAQALPGALWSGEQIGVRRLGDGAGQEGGGVLLAEPALLDDRRQLHGPGFGHRRGGAEARRIRSRARRTCRWTFSGEVVESTTT